MSIEQKRISAENLAIFCEQTALLLQSGILLHEGVQMMAEDAPKGAIKEALSCVAEQLSENRSFDQALEASGAFPPYLIRMAAIGSEAGQLDQVMSSLAVYYKRDASLQNTLKGAVLYPSVLVVMMAAVLLIISVKVLPVFQTVLQGLGTQLSPVATSILTAGAFFSRFSVIFVGIAAVLAALIFFFTFAQKGRTILSDWFSKTKIAESMALSSLASSLSILLASGIDPEQAFELSLPLLRNRRIKNKAEACLRRLSEDRLPFADSIEQSQLFSAMTNSMLATGSRTGTLDAIMKYTADLYEDLFENTVTRRLSLIEPISVAVLSIFVGIVLIAVMLPLLGVMSSIGA